MPDAYRRRVGANWDGPLWRPPQPLTIEGVRAVAIAGEDRIHEYRFVRSLFQGQAAQVIEVVDGAGRRFVLKQILPSLAKDREEVGVLSNEAKIGQSLIHRNILRTHKFVRTTKAEPAYIVMDYFPSMDLRKPLRTPQRFELPRRIHQRILQQAGMALAYMHDQGWVHRDIKPDNILVNKSGEVRLIDFALARRIPTGLGKLLAGKPPRQGTYSYISPEQLMQKPPAATADIYSFGITCYELACGRPPFTGNSSQELLRKQVRMAPAPLTGIQPLVTAEYAELVLSMLEKKPENRPALMHEVVSRLSKIALYKDDGES